MGYDLVSVAADIAAVSNWFHNLSVTDEITKEQFMEMEDRTTRVQEFIIELHNATKKLEGEDETDEETVC